MSAWYEQISGATNKTQLNHIRDVWAEVTVDMFFSENLFTNVGSEAQRPVRRLRLGRPHCSCLCSVTSWAHPLNISISNCPLTQHWSHEPILSCTSLPEPKCIVFYQSPLLFNSIWKSRFHQKQWKWQERRKMKLKVMFCQWAAVHPFTPRRSQLLVMYGRHFKAVHPHVVIMAHYLILVVLDRQKKTALSFLTEQCGLKEEFGEKWSI